QAELGDGLPELDLQGRWTPAFAGDLWLSLPLGLLCRQSDELAATRFRREAPGCLASFSRLLCSHVGGCPFVGFPSGQDIRSGCTSLLSQDTKGRHVSNRNAMK